MSILDLFPNELKQQLWDAMPGFLARQSDRVVGEKMSRVLSQFSSQATFHKSFATAITRAVERFQIEYRTQDKELVDARTALEKYVY